MIRIILSEKGISIYDDKGICIDNYGMSCGDSTPPEYWSSGSTPKAELTPEEVHQVFDTIREILEVRT